MKDKEKVLKHYKDIKNSMDMALETVRGTMSIDDEETQRVLEKLSTELNGINLAFKADIDKLEKQSEWDKLCVAFFGETNAGKSTLIDALRILYNEQTRMIDMKRSAKEYENALATNNENYKKVDENLKAYMTTIEGYAYEVNEREKKYQADIMNLQKAVQYQITLTDNNQKQYQAIINNLQNNLGLSLERAAKQEEKNKKLKMFALIGCLACIVLGYFMSRYIF